jgi:hypothetical protein
VLDCQEGRAERSGAAVKRPDEARRHSRPARRVAFARADQFVKRLKRMTPYAFRRFPAGSAAQNAMPIVVIVNKTG